MSQYNPWIIFQIYEENQPNYKIAQLTAIDADSRDNARLAYHMEWDKNQYNIDKLFKINEQGQIIAKQSLDREEFLNGFQFTVSQWNLIFEFCIKVINK